MAHTYTQTGTGTIFTVGERAPSAHEVLEGVHIPNREPASLALRLTADVARNPEVLDTTEKVDEYVRLKIQYPARYAGRVVLDTTVEPPKLILEEVAMWCEPVTRDTATGALIESELSRYWPGSPQEVTGTYTGTQDEILSIRS